MSESQGTLFVDEGAPRASSPFFDMALNKEWKGGQTKVVELLDDYPEIFRMHAEWL